MTTTDGPAALLQHHRDDLYRSGLTDATIAAMHVYTETDQEKIARLLNRKKQDHDFGACLVVPYLSVGGEPVNYHILKPDRPRTEKKNDKVRARKYELPAGRGNQLYIPPSVGPFLYDPTVPLNLTEGPKKGAKAAQEGFPTVALSGTWNWSNGQKQLIAALASIPWADRLARVIFDSDAATNDSVAKAEVQLAQVLETRGAIIRVVRLPGRPDGLKVGLDDYLIAYGPDQLRLLLDPPPPPPPARMTLADVVETFGRWMHLEDDAALELSLATVVANRMTGDQVWLLLVGPPSSGKTEVIQAVADAAPEVVLVGTVSEAALLSGTSRKDYTTATTGGLLRQIGKYGILAPKDLGTLLSMNKDARAQALAALREVYDGKWVRHVGSDGGREISWSGKCGLVGGSTPAIDRHHGIVSALGDRFVYLRMPTAGREKRGRAAVKRALSAGTMRQELARAVAGVLAHAPVPTEPPVLSDDEENRQDDLTAGTPPGHNLRTGRGDVVLGEPDRRRVPVAPHSPGRRSGWSPDKSATG